MFEIFGMILLVLLQLFLIGIIFILLSLSFQAIFGVPWERTPRKMNKTMFELASLKKGEHIIDFGSGDGSMIIDAVRDYGAKGTGIEGRRDLTLWARSRARWHGLHKQTTFLRGDMFSMDLPNADVVITYLLPETNAKLEPILIDKYPEGTRVVARQFSFPTLDLIETKKAHNNTFYLYKIPVRHE